MNETRPALPRYVPHMSAGRETAGATGTFRNAQGIDLPRRTKILHVIHLTNPESGGPIEAVLRFSEVLVREGHEVEVVSLESAEETARRSFPCKVTGLGRGRGKYGYNPRLACWVNQNAPRFDVVILHGLWNYSSFGGWRGLRKQSTPYYIFPHGMMDPWFRQQSFLKHLAKQAYWWLAEGRVLRDADRVLFTCEEEKIRAHNAFFGWPYNGCVAGLGTADPEGDANAERAAFAAVFPFLKRKRFFLFLSRIHPKKGCDLLIQAFADLVTETPPDLDLVIAGPDQTGWVPELQQLAGRLGIAGRVHWPGMLKGELKWGAFRSADALILPSHQENFGFVVAESLGCSTPVLISDKVNIWREVKSFEAGLVESDTLEGTRNLIQKFLALSSDELAKMKLASRRAFLEQFSAEAATHDLLRLINSTSVERPGRRDRGD